MKGESRDVAYLDFFEATWRRIWALLIAASAPADLSIGIPAVTPAKAGIQIKNPGPRLPSGRRPIIGEEAPHPHSLEGGWILKGFMMPYIRTFAQVERDSSLFHPVEFSRRGLLKSAPIVLR